MKIEPLHQQPGLIHNCHRGNCVKRAKYTVVDQDSKKVENLCGHHAKTLSEKKNIPMPKKVVNFTEHDINRFATGYLRPGHVEILLGRRDQHPPWRIRWIYERVCNLAESAQGALVKANAFVLPETAKNEWNEEGRKRTIAYWQDAVVFWSALRDWAKEQYAI